MEKRVYHLNTLSGQPNICKLRGVGCHFGTLEDHFTDLSKADEASRGKNFNTVGDDPTLAWDKGIYHANLGRVGEILATPAPGVINHWYTTHGGTYNPQTGDNGLKPGIPHPQGLLILVNATGDRARCLAAQDFIPSGNLPSHLGEWVEQEKKRDSGWAFMPNLRLVGVVEANGTLHGYVPMKRISYFVGANPW